jgi:hypothetical protein
MVVEESSMSDRSPSQRSLVKPHVVKYPIQSLPDRGRWLGAIGLAVCLALGGQWAWARAIASHHQGHNHHSVTTAIGSPIAQSSPRRRTQSPARNYSRAALDYFMEVAFGNEFSNNPDTNYIRKWVNVMRLKVLGSPTAADLATVDRIVTDLNRLMGGQMQIVRVTQDANATIYFVPESEFATYDPQYVPRNLGFFRVWWNQKLEIQRARILISTTGINQRERSHLIREELTQSLGLMNDSDTYRDSTFYQGWTDTQEFTMLDCDLIRMLYDARVRAGMTRDHIRQLFSR